MVYGGTVDKEDGHDTMNKEEGDITMAMDKEETISKKILTHK